MVWGRFGTKNDDGVSMVQWIGDAQQLLIHAVMTNEVCTEFVWPTVQQNKL